jgi:hypothetical protein
MEADSDSGGGAPCCVRAAITGEDADCISGEAETGRTGAVNGCSRSKRVTKKLLE